MVKSVQSAKSLILIRKRWLKATFFDLPFLFARYLLEFIVET